MKTKRTGTSFAKPQKVLAVRGAIATTVFTYPDTMGMVLFANNSWRKERGALGCLFGGLKQARSVRNVQENENDFPEREVGQEEEEEEE